MKELSSFFKKNGARNVWYLAFIIAAGVLLMFFGGRGTGGNDKTPLIPLADADGSADYASSDGNGSARDIEERLESVLSCVEGAGDIRVMLTVAATDEVTLAQDVTYEKTSEAAENGRVSQTERRDIKHVLATGGNAAQPVVTKRASPAVTGAVIVARGAGSAEVKASLVRAAAAALNLPAHKIEVLKMDAGK